MIAFLYARIRMLVAPDVILQVVALILIFAGVITRTTDAFAAGGAVLLLGLVVLPLINKSHAAKVVVPDERTVDLPFDTVLDLVARRTSKFVNLLPSSRRANVDRALSRTSKGSDATFFRKRAFGTLVVRVGRLAEGETVVGIHGTDLRNKYTFPVFGIRVPYLYAGSYLHRHRREIFYFLDYLAGRARAADSPRSDGELLRALGLDPPPFGIPRDRRAETALLDQIVAQMERFGRYSQSHSRVAMLAESGTTEAALTEAVRREILAPLYYLVQEDPGRLVDLLRERVLTVGGWAVRGASRALIELPFDLSPHPAYNELLEHSLEFLRSRGFPASVLSPLELDFWEAKGGTQENWLTGKARPTLAEAPVTDLAPGELRPLIRFSEDPHGNVVLVRRHHDGTYVGVVERRWSDDDLRRAQTEDYHAVTLSDLYWKIGSAFQISTYWHDPELGPYFPSPSPRLD